MQQEIFIFGNPLIPNDRLPIDLLPALQHRFPKLRFSLRDPNENLEPIEGELTIIDTAIGIANVEVIRNLDQLETPTHSCSLHDFDLACNLLLLSKLGELKRVTIFAVPKDINSNDALEQLTTLINVELRETR